MHTQGRSSSGGLGLRLVAEDEAPAPVSGTVLTTHLRPRPVSHLCS